MALKNVIVLPLFTVITGSYIDTLEKIQEAISDTTIVKSNSDITPKNTSFIINGEMSRTDKISVFDYEDNYKFGISSCRINIIDISKIDKGLAYHDAFFSTIHFNEVAGELAIVRSPILPPGLLISYSDLENFINYYFLVREIHIKEEFDKKTDYKKRLKDYIKCRL